MSRVILDAGSFPGLAFCFWQVFTLTRAAAQQNERREPRSGGDLLYRTGPVSSFPAVAIFGCCFAFWSNETRTQYTHNSQLYTLSLSSSNVTLK
jgi:hypothetical protein